MPLNVEQFYFGDLTHDKSSYYKTDYVFLKENIYETCVNILHSLTFHALTKMVRCKLLFTSDY